MTLSDLIKQARVRLDDTAQPYLWSDAELTAYLNEAVTEAAIRAKLIKDRSTRSVTRISLTPTGEWYKLHPAIFDVEMIAYLDGSKPITMLGEHELPPEWQTHTGDVRHFIVDADKLRPYKLPTQAATLDLVVYRAPLKPLEGADDVPEIPAADHYRVIDWAIRCAYLKRDSDAYDESRANTHEAMFTASFGIRPDSNVRRKQAENRRRTVRAINF